MLTDKISSLYTNIVINFKESYMAYRLNKADLGAYLQTLMHEAGISCRKERATNMVTEMFNYINSSVANGYKVSIHSFGVFEPSFRKATVRNNPQDPTGTVKVEVPAKYVPKFAAYSFFKEQVATYDGEEPFGATDEQKVECETEECTVQ